MHLEIATPEHKVFSGNVYGIQLPGIEGSFEILDKHAPMIASLGKGKMKIIKDKKQYEAIAEPGTKLSKMFFNEKVTPGLKALLTRAAEWHSFDQVETRLATVQQQTRAIFNRLMAAQ